MPDLNWDRFRALAGSSADNFQRLCRGIVRRQFERFGTLGGTANQPGVEFHLKVTGACDLGDAGRWWGWQCRWWDLGAGKSIGPARRSQVEKAIATTEKFLPGMTDWVLWTKRPLTPSDAAWFNRIATKMQLHSWTDQEIEELLSGDALLLRSVYFGELVLGPSDLGVIRETSLAYVRRRWHPELHQEIECEREIRGILGEPEAWSELRAQVDRLAADNALMGGVSQVPRHLRPAAKELRDFAKRSATSLTAAYDALRHGKVEDPQFASTVPQLSREALSLPRRLRAERHLAAIYAANLLADIEDAREILERLDDALGSRIVAVVADAGEGKSHFSAQLTVATSDRPAGMLLLGAQLAAGDGLDALARRITIHGTPVESMERLIAALDAAGGRAARRMPLVIDGLNEAEDPRNWRGALAALMPTLAQYPQVLVVCTVRSAFIDEALPPEVRRIEVNGFGHDTRAAVERYFRYYQIDATDSELPWEQLSHPLTLFWFCEVTNPSRAKQVAVDAGPGSLSELFEKYLEQVAGRIAELSPTTHRYYVPEVRDALDEVGVALWEESTRTLDRRRLRERLGDASRAWNQSLVHALEDEGILMQYPGRDGGPPGVAVSYDALAGHIVAQAILHRRGRDGVRSWIAEEATIQWLTLGSASSHPLAQDILASLVALGPRILSTQIWPLLSEPLRTAALLEAANLAGPDLDVDTVNELKAIPMTRPSHAGRIFIRSYSTRGLDRHPLNARFLDECLAALSVAGRDALWSEWVRRNTRGILDDLERLEDRWGSTNPLASGDDLRARWVKWLLTSTVTPLRDHASKVLYLFGRHDPKGLFELAIDALSINDAYVPERVLAASYGVAIAKQLPDDRFGPTLATFLSSLKGALDDSLPRFHASHRIIRLYTTGLLLFARKFYALDVPSDLRDRRLSFGSSPAISFLAEDDPAGVEAGAALHNDFENYTVGRLFDDRGNYQTEHEGYQKALAYIRGAVWQLGWRENGLGAIDSQLIRDWGRPGPRTERYGKKYGWIGLHNYAGVLEDAGELQADGERFSDVHIDPSFPLAPPLVPLVLEAWARPVPASDQKWIEAGSVSIPDDLLRPMQVGESRGPWVAVDGYLQHESGGRRAFAILAGVVVAQRDVPDVLRLLRQRGHPGNEWAGDDPSDHYIFAGEIPWHPAFAVGEDGSETYSRDVGRRTGKELRVETLAHRYSWESYHSPLNAAGGALVPSRRFSDTFDLRGLPQMFDQALPDGSLAARSFQAPAGFTGQVLYLREDLVRKYIARRAFVWFVWGERQLDFPVSGEPPAWLMRAFERGADTWRVVRTLDEFASHPRSVAARRRATKRSRAR